MRNVFLRTDPAALLLASLRRAGGPIPTRPSPEGPLASVRAPEAGACRERPFEEPSRACPTRGLGPILVPTGLPVDESALATTLVAVEPEPLAWRGSRSSRRTRRAGPLQGTSSSRCYTRRGESRGLGQGRHGEDDHRGDTGEVPCTTRSSRAGHRRRLEPQPG